MADRRPQPRPGPTLGAGWMGGQRGGEAARGRLTRHRWIGNIWVAEAMRGPGHRQHLTPAWPPPPGIQQAASSPGRPAGTVQPRMNIHHFDFQYGNVDFG